MDTLMLLPDDPAVTNRRIKLREWIDTHFGGQLSLFISSTNDGTHQMNQGELSALLRNKTFGERRARSLEAKAHMPPRYLDSPPAQKSTATGHIISEQVMQLHSHVDATQNPPPPVGWPFAKVSLERLVNLRKQLGPRAGSNAMHDIDETLDLVVTKWEQRASTSAKSAA